MPVYTGITLQWSADSITENSETYQIQIDTNINFVGASIINAYAASNSHNFTPVHTSEYYWRIRGINTRQSGSWSLINKIISSGNPNLALPVLQNFSNNACTNVQSNTFSVIKQRASDTVFFYVNNQLIDTSSNFTDTGIYFNYNFTYQGSYNFYFTGADSTGTYANTTQIYIIKYDTTSPAITSYTTFISTMDSNPEIIVRYSDDTAGIDTQHITVFVDSGAGQINWTGQTVITADSAYFQPRLQTGANTYFITIPDLAGNTVALSQKFIVVSNHSPYFTQPLPAINDIENTGAITINLNNYAADSDVKYDSLHWAICAETGHIVTANITVNQIYLTPVADTYGAETITLSVTDNKDTIFADLRVYLSNVPNTPAIPVLLTPSNNIDTSANAELFFSWSADSKIENTDSYQIQIDTDINFSGVLLLDSALLSNSISVKPAVYSQYYWRVRGLNPVKTGDWSLINKFKIKDFEPPLIISPSITDNFGLSIDIGDNKIVISSNISDTSRLKTIAYFYSINDTSYSHNNYFWINPDSGFYSKTFLLNSILNVGDTIYYKIYSEDFEFNNSEYKGFTSVSSIVIDSPVFSSILKNSVRTSPLTLYGKKYPASTVKINNSYNAISVSDTEWSISADLISETNIISARAYIGTTYSETSYFTVLYDNVPPVLFSNIPETIYNTPFIITISGTDALSSLDTIFYRVNSGIWNSGSSVLINTNGNNIIEYFGYDSLGNASQVSAGLRPAKFDSIPPFPTAVFDDGEISADTSIDFSWNLPADSASIIDYYVEVDELNNFISPLFSGWLNKSGLHFIISSDSGIINGETYYCRVKSKDEAGNISDFGTPSNGIFVDTSLLIYSKPEPPFVNGYPAEINQSYITLTGQKTDTAVFVLVNGSQADIAGNNWSKLILLQNGLNIISLYSKNSYGAQSEEIKINIYMDNISPSKPTASVLSPTNKHFQVITGTKSADAETIYVNNQPAKIVSAAEWIDTVYFTQYNNTINITAADTFSNISETSVYSIIYDTEPPAVPTANYISPYSGIEQNLSGNYDTMSTQILRVNGLPASLNFISGEWFCNIQLFSEGNNSVNIIAYDAAGNTSVKNLNIVRDMTGPSQPAIIFPHNNIALYSSPVYVSGTVESGAFGVLVNNVYETNLVSNAFSVPVNLTVGNNLITVYALDNLYNKSEPYSIIANYNPEAFLIISPQLDNNEILNFIPDSLYIYSNNGLDASTITDTIIILSKNGQKLNYSLKINSDTTGFYAIPQQPFRIHNTYKLDITGYLKNDSHKTLNQTKTWIFRTGTDDTPPVISNFQTLDDEEKLYIDTTDTAIVLKASVSDSHIGIDYIRFELGINNPSKDDYNFTFMNPGSGISSFIKSFNASLSDSDIIYSGIYARDLAGNITELNDSKQVGNVIVPIPALSPDIDTTVSYTPVLLYGAKEPEVLVFVNSIPAVASDTDKWMYNFQLSQGINNYSIYGRIVNSASSAISGNIIFDNTIPSITDNAPVSAKFDSQIISIIASDFESGIKNVYYSLNNSPFVKGDTVLINSEYQNVLKYAAENNCELWSDTATKIVYIDRTKPEDVKCYDEGIFSFDTALVWSWDAPFDSSQIAGYYIEISDSISFSNIIASETVNGSQNLIMITGDYFINEKTYYARVQASDIAGNKSDTSNPMFWSDGIKIDTGLANEPAPPAPKIMLPLNGIETGAASIIISGLKDTTAIIVSVNGLNAVITDTFSWHKNISLTSGANTIFVTAKNNAGKESEADSIIIYLDNIAPSKPVILTNYTISNIDTVIIKGIKEAGSFIEINGSVSNVQLGADTFSKIFVQPEGAAIYEIVSFDALNNRSDTASITVTVDKTPPAVPTVVYMSPTKDTIQIISGTMELNSKLSVNGNTESVLIFLNTWQYQVLLSEGENSFLIKACDYAGNFSETEVLILLDTLPPDKPAILIPANNYKTASSSINVSGTKPINSYVYLNGVLAQNNNYADTFWSAEYGMLVGANLISAVAKDELGNASQSDQIIVSYDANLFLAETPFLEDKDFVAPFSKLDIVLNKQLDAASMNSDNIYFTLENGTKIIPDSFSYSASNFTITVYCSIKQSKQYQFVISKNISDISGVKLNQSRVYQFITTISNSESSVTAFGSNLEILTPANSLPDNSYFIVEELPANNPQVIIGDNSLDFNGYIKNPGIHRKIFDIKCFTSNGLNITGFDSPIAIKINYPDADNNGILDNSDLSERLLAIYYFDNQENKWIKQPYSIVESSDNYVMTYTNHLTIFTIFGGKLDSDTVVIFRDSLNNPKLHLFIPDANNMYVTASELNPYDNAKIIAADDKLLKSSGFIKSLGSARPIYSLTAKNSNDQILPNFAAPVRIYFNWLDSDNNGIIDNSDIREKYISIYCLDEINNQWIKVNTAIDELNNSASADVNHFSVYTLFGANFTEGGILFYPNPTLNKKINLSITTAPQSGNTMRLTIINPFGRLVYENSFPLVSGTVNQFFDIDLSALPVGGYYAKIEYGGFSKILGIGIGK